MYSKSQHLKSRRSVNDLFFGGPYGDSAHRHTTLPSSNCVRFGAGLLWRRGTLPVGTWRSQG